MPMLPNEHENILDQLNNPEITHTDRMNLLAQLRQDYADVVTDFDKLSKTTSKLTEENTDLVKVNSKLFRQLGSTNLDEETQRKNEEASFSESITINKLINGGSV